MLVRLLKPYEPYMVLEKTVSRGMYYSRVLVATTGETGWIFGRMAFRRKFLDLTGTTG